MKIFPGFPIFAIALFSVIGSVADANPSKESSWAGDISPIAKSDWNKQRVAHLLERAGFGSTPAEIAEFTKLDPKAAVRRLVYFEGAPEEQLPPFDHSGVHDPGLEPFPPSRPATTNLASKNGEALGVKVKASGNRRLQPVVNRFFYWLRASRLETDRVSYWWGNRMLRSPRPLKEKMALFWHGHFAVNESKVRDYRKHLQLLQVFHQYGLGNFRDLLIATAKSPAMLSFLDAGVNVKGAPNENFAREIMELFTLGVGHYSEKDIREAARAFTGWYYNDLKFVARDDKHDKGNKTVLGQTGNFSGEDIIDILLAQPADEYITAKLYRYFVNDNPSEDVTKKLARVLRKNNYNISALMETIFLSRDFYSPKSVGSIIKSPVQLVVSTYRKLELSQVPGVPDFNSATRDLGQHLFNPPTVAGWAQGRAWITPSLLVARKNFAYDVIFPDINFVPHDRFPRDPLIRSVSKRLAAGAVISKATNPPGVEDKDNMSMANLMADMDQDFNTRYGSYRGWQMALEKVKPIPRHTAALDLAGIVKQEKLMSAEEIVDHFLLRLMSVRATSEQRNSLIKVFKRDLGTDNIEAARSYIEDPLRALVHRIMSLPEYQLG